MIVYNVFMCINVYNMIVYKKFSFCGCYFPDPDGSEDNSEATSKILVNSFGNVECVLNAINFLKNSNFVYGQIIYVDFFLKKNTPNKDVKLL